MPAGPVSDRQAAGSSTRQHPADRSANDQSGDTGRAGEIGGARIGRPNDSRIARVVAGGWIAARMRIGLASQRGQRKTSISKTDSPCFGASGLEGEDDDSKISLVLVGPWTGGLAIAETRDAGQGRALVDLNLAAEEYHVGDSLTVRLGIRDARNVGSMAFHVPPAVEGPFLGSDGTTTVFLASDVGGEIVVGMSRLGDVPGISGSGELASFSFEAVGPGVGELRFTGAAVKSPTAENLPAKFQDARLTVVDSPETGSDGARQCHLWMRTVH